MKSYEGKDSPLEALPECGHFNGETAKKAADYWPALGKLVLEFNLQDIMEVTNKSELLPLPRRVDGILSHTRPRLLSVVRQECLGLSRKNAQLHIGVWLEEYSPSQSMGGKVCRKRSMK